MPKNEISFSEEYELFARSGRRITSKSGKAKALRKFIKVAEIVRTHADKASAPPIDIKDAYGASACEKAIRIQENPPNGNKERTSSIRRSAGINQKMFVV
jgi:hypothetical protein